MKQILLQRWLQAVQARCYDCVNTLRLWGLTSDCHPKNEDIFSPRRRLKIAPRHLGSVQSRLLSYCLARSGGMRHMKNNSCPTLIISMFHWAHLFTAGECNIQTKINVLNLVNSKYPKFYLIYIITLFTCSYGRQYWQEVTQVLSQIPWTLQSPH